MNSAQLDVVGTRKNRQLARSLTAIAARANVYRTPGLGVGRERGIRYVSRSSHQPASTEPPTQNSSDTPQPKKLRQPSKASPSNEDLASSLSAAAWNNLGIALASLDQYDDALSAFDRALTVDPTFDRAQDNARRMQHLTGEE